jgi:hypothetical protein
MAKHSGAILQNEKLSIVITPNLGSLEHFRIFISEKNQNVCELHHIMMKCLCVQDRAYEIFKDKSATPTSYVGLESETSDNTGCTSVTMEPLRQFTEVHCIQRVHITEAVNNKTSI